jgi:hypothetical protein
MVSVKAGPGGKMVPCPAALFSDKIARKLNYQLITFP